MSYFIKQTHPTLDTEIKSVYFHSWLKNLKIDDTFGNWNLNGDYYIYSNSELPQEFAFYLRCKTFFVEVKNIPLLWEENIIQKNISNSLEQAFKIDKYSFNFEINTNDITIFKQKLVDQALEFEFMPSFNNSILNDFKVTTSTNDLQKFMNETRHNLETKIFKFTNFIELNNEINSIDFGFENLESDLINIRTFDWLNLDSPIDNLFKLFKYSNKQMKIKNLIISINYKLNNLKEKLFENSFIDQTILENVFDYKCKNIIFDSNLNELIFEHNSKPFWIPKIAKGIIEINFKLTYGSTIKNIQLKEDFSFLKNNLTNFEDSINVSESIYTNFETVILNENII